jgi:hypothetical protein
MADVKISALPAATTPLGGTEVLPIVQSSTTKKVSIADVTAGRAVSASSLTLTTPLAASSGGTGLSALGTGVATAFGNNTNAASGLAVLNASGYLAVGQGGTGLGSLTAGYIPYGNGTNAFSSSSGFVFDGSNLGVGVSSPAYKLDVRTTGDSAVYFATTGASNSMSAFLASGNGTASGKYAYFRFLNNDSVGREWRIGTYGSDSLSLYTGAILEGFTLALSVDTAKVLNVCASTATPSGGSTSARLIFGTTSGFGIYYGSGAPTVSAAQGSIYLRSDGSSTSTRFYVNTSGSTTWTNVTTAA